MTKANTLIKSHRQTNQFHQNKLSEVFSVLITVFIILACLLIPTTPEVIYRVDPLALLAATLRTYQRAGCDSDQLSLSCPRGTSISIELAQYGRAGDLSDHSLCPPTSNEDLTTMGSTQKSVIHSGTEIEIKPPETCTVSGLQYALLQTVVDACQKKRHCKFAANGKTHSSGDPCSGIRKFVEIAYKCRPYEFRSKMACENDNMPLVCNPYSRIAIYSAVFGYSGQQSMLCAGQNSLNLQTQQNHNTQSCLVSYATETVMQVCHGRRKCTITADTGTFGRPCKTDLPLFLKVVYTCIPRKVLKDRYETAPEPDEPQQTDLESDQDELYDEDQFYKESEAIPPAPKLQSTIPKAGQPFDINVHNEPSTTTKMPQTFSYNNDSIDEPMQSSAWMLNRIKTSFNQNADNNNSNNAAIATSNEAFIKDSIPKNSVDVKTDVNTNPNGRKFFFQKRCQMEDDWGKIGLNCTEENIIKERVDVIGFLINWIDSYNHIKKNQEEFYFYLIISMIVCVLICLTVIIGRLTLQKRRNVRKNSDTSIHTMGKSFVDPVASTVKKKKQSKNSGSQIADTFVDDISEIDADIDLTSSITVPSIHMQNESFVTYAPTVGKYNYEKLNVQSSGEKGMGMSGENNGLSGKPTTYTSVSLENHQKNSFDESQSIYTSMGTFPSSITMGTHFVGIPGFQLPAQSQVNQLPKYLKGTLMIPAQQHNYGGTLRKTYIPTSSGILATTASNSGNIPSIPVSGYSSSSGIYYDSTVPRNINRVMSTDNNPFYFG